MIQPLQLIGIHPLATGMTLWLMLTCSAVTQLPTLSVRQVLTPETTRVEPVDFNLAAAFARLAVLPGYQLVSQNTTRDSAGEPVLLTSTTEIDLAGSSHTLTYSSDGSETETYVVAGRGYTFDPQYAGWVEQPAPPLALTEADRLIQRLAPFDASLREAGRGSIAGRSAIRYELQYSRADLTQAFGNNAADVSGLVWVDTETGAPLKLEIRLYPDKAGQPGQEFELEVSQIGQIAPIAAPTPVVDPAAIAAATTTAQSLTVLEASLDYQGELLRFELTPMQVIQSPNVTPLTAEMRLLLRQLPPQLFLPTNLEPFLTHLGGQLALSIPERNEAVPSSSFRLESSDTAQNSLEVVYVFKANLEDFSHVELILSGQGNPAIAPVPVGNRD